MVGGCCVCSDDRGFEENPLVYCDGQGCDVAVHQACYGIVDVPSGPWFCRKCESQERSAKIKCELCPSKKGALKRCENNGWAHVVCALYIPEVRFGNNNTMEPIILQLIPQDRYNKTCYLCEEGARASKASYGACMDCKKTGCKQYFHVTCAQSAGLLCEEAGLHSDEVIYCGYCKQHYNKLKKDHISDSTKIVKKPTCTINDSCNQPNLSVIATTSTVLNAGASNSSSTEKSSIIPNNSHGNRKIEQGTRISGFYSSSMMLSPNSTNSFNIGSPNLSLSTSSSSSSSSSSPSTSSSRSSSSTSSNSASPAQSSPNFPSKLATVRSEPLSSDNLQTQQIQATLPGIPPKPNGNVQNFVSSQNQKTDITQNNAAKNTRTEIEPVLSAFKPPSTNTVLLSNTQSVQSVSENNSSTNNSDSILSPSSSKSKKKANNAKSRSIAQKNTNSSEEPHSPAIEPKPKRCRATKRSASISSNEAQKSKDAIPSEPKRRSRATSGENPTSKRSRKKKDKTENNTTLIDASKDTISLKNPVIADSSCNLANLRMMINPQANNKPANLNVKNELPIPNNSSHYSFINSHAIPKPNTTKLLIPTLNSSSSPSNDAKSLEELLKNHWDQTSKYILEQAQQFDIASLIGVLHTIKHENERLEERVRGLTTRRDALIAMNARLDMPPNNLIQHLKGTHPVFNSLTTMINYPYGSRITSPGSQQPARINSTEQSKINVSHSSFNLNGFKDHPNASPSPVNVQMAHASNRPSPNPTHNTQYLPPIYNHANQYNHMGFDIQNSYSDTPPPSSALSPRQTLRVSRQTGNPSSLILNISNINSNGMSNGSRNTSNTITEPTSTIPAQHQIAGLISSQPNQIMSSSTRNGATLSNRNTK